MLPVLFYYLLVVREQILCFCNEGMREFIRTHMARNSVSIEIRKSLEVLVQNISSVKNILDIGGEGSPGDERHKGSTSGGVGEPQAAAVQD